MPARNADRAWNESRAELFALAHIDQVEFLAAVESSFVSRYTHRVPVTPYRGAGQPQAVFVIERVLDLVARETGHITQSCVAPSQRGQGVGYALLRRSMLALAAHGCRTVGLTVTSTNASAIRLYQEMGFTDRREFVAYVWDSW